MSNHAVSYSAGLASVVTASNLRRPGRTLGMSGHSVKARTTWPGIPMPASANDQSGSLLQRSPSARGPGQHTPPARPDAGKARPHRKDAPHGAGQTTGD